MTKNESECSVIVNSAGRRRIVTPRPAVFWATWLLPRTVALAPVLVATLLLIGSRPVQGAVNADSLHWASWDSSLASSEPAVRYSFYAYRTLAVPHPETYLLADSLFSEIVEHLPGTRTTFRGGAVRDIHLYDRMLKGKQKGLAFNWRLWAPKSEDIRDVPDSNNALSWLDRRLPSAAVVLRSDPMRMSTAEGAMLRYTQLRRIGHAVDDLFVIIDGEGRGYLARDSTILSAATGRPLEPAEGGGASISPALVFNERSVFYPLFGHDDRAQDRGLSRVVARLGPPAVIRLTATEQRRIKQLAAAAALPTPQAKAMAVIAALGGLRAQDPYLRAAWNTCLQVKDTLQAGFERGMVRLAVYWANRLSLPLARLAATAPDAPFDSVALQWHKEYLARCGRRIKPRDSTNHRLEAWGLLWFPRLLEIPFDDIMRTRAGESSSQALAMAAAMDLLGWPDLRLEVFLPGNERPDQLWVIAGEGHWQFNLGQWTRIRRPADASTQIPLLISSYGNRDHWTNLSDSLWFTNNDNLSITADLSDLRAMIPMVTMYVPGRGDQRILLVDMLRAATADSIPWRFLPWPAVTGRGDSQ